MHQNYKRPMICPFFFSLSLSLSIFIEQYIYIYVCVCVCMFCHCWPLFQYCPLSHWVVVGCCRWMGRKAARRDDDISTNNLQWILDNLPRVLDIVDQKEETRQ